ncbi:unnamed protein product [Cyclocybe aegerita]|uniref:Mid2 domain-containing protein n=1 Tax=Cyclocybe aegerita TaxID=1973307 RepID=A0A8S0XJN8_CYCAE|nr:unnamed protein product [Cyclocybe aegerita]
MFSSRKQIVPLFVYLSLLLASSDFAAAHLQKRDHVNLKRIMKKRSPFPQDEGSVLLPGAIGAAPIPSQSSSTSDIAVLPSSSSTASSSVETSASSTSASSSASESASSSVASSSSESSSAPSATPTTTSAAPPAQTSEALNVTGVPAVITSTGAAVTKTESVEPSQTIIPDAQSNSSISSEAKGMTMTILIAVAASIGAIAIIWTVFRKWKLSSSKEFDRRLNPIDWQPTTGEDDIIPTHRRATSNTSSRSGSGHGHARGAGAGAAGVGMGASSAYGHGANSDHGHGHANPNPFDDFDSPTNGAPVGGYADLNRGPSPTNQMQERLARGPSVNRGYETAVPLHHQGYDAYPTAPRY